MHRYQCKESRIIKKRVNIMQIKVTKTPITDSKDMEICEQSDEEFRRILFQRFNELQNTETEN